MSCGTRLWTGESDSTRRRSGRIPSAVVLPLEQNVRVAARQAQQGPLQQVRPPARRLQKIQTDFSKENRTKLGVSLRGQRFVPKMEEPALGSLRRLLVGADSTAPVPNMSDDFPANSHTRIFGQAAIKMCMPCVAPPGGACKRVELRSFAGRPAARTHRIEMLCGRMLYRQLRGIIRRATGTDPSRLR